MRKPLPQRAPSPGGASTVSSNQSTPHRVSHGGAHSGSHGGSHGGRHGGGHSGGHGTSRHQLERGSGSGGGSEPRWRKSLGQEKYGYVTLFKSEFQTLVRPPKQVHDLNER